MGNGGKDAVVVDGRREAGYIMMAALRNFPQLEIVFLNVESAVSAGTRTCLFQDVLVRNLNFLRQYWEVEH